MMSFVMKMTNTEEQGRESERVRRSFIITYDNDQSSGFPGFLTFIDLASVSQQSIFYSPSVALLAVYQEYE